MIKAVIFDMDGVVVDTEKLNFTADSNVLKSVGIVVDESEYVKYTGNPARKIYTEILKDRGKTEDIEAMLASREGEIKNALQEVDLKTNPGFTELVEKLKAGNYILALASSSPKTKVEDVLEYLKLEDTFSLVITGSDVTKNKPEPDIYLETAKRLGVSSEECVVIEDSATGVAAAKKAGMMCIVLSTKHTSDQNVSGADKTVENLALIDIKDVEKIQTLNR
jgi:HAD superfamily hydrolase (TIGR01509 family)